MNYPLKSIWFWGLRSLTLCFYNELFKILNIYDIKYGIIGYTFFGSTFKNEEHVKPNI